MCGSRLLKSLVRWCAPLAIGLACGFVFVGDLAAEFATPNTKLKKDQSAVAADLRNQNFAEADQPTFDAYFNEYLLLQLADPASDLPALSQKLRTQYFGQGKSGEPYARLARLTFDMMKKIISEKWPDEPKYEALQMNAMLVIGDLNEQEGAAGGKPKPLAAALQYMLRVVNDPKQPDYLRVPALLRIQRHCECFSAFPVGADTRKEIAVAMLKLLKQKTPPANRDPSAQAWMRRLALQTLETIGAPGVEGGADVVEAVVAVLRDEDNPMTLRCAAAATFSDLKVTGLNQVNPLELSNQLAAIAVVVGKQEIELARQGDESAFNGRRLKTAWRDIYYGLAGRDGKRGLLLAIPEARRPPVEEGAKKLKDALTAPTLTPDDLEKKVRDLEKIFKLPAKPVGPAPAAAGAAPPDAAPTAGPGNSPPKTGLRKPSTPIGGPLAGTPAAP